MKKIVLLLCSFSAFADDSILDLGEKIFNDTRFSKSKTVSCASCHMIDQSFGEQGMRIYNDFQARTKLAIEINGDKTTLRNTPGLVGIGSKFSRHNFSHHDGELVHRQTYLGNFTGKNMGWAEKGLATKNVVKTLRSNEYREEFMSLPGSWSIDLERLTDDQMIEQMIKVGTYYLFDLDFQTDEQGHYIGSPYDQFLKENGIDRGPRESETNMQYSARIRKEFMQLDNPVYVQKKHFPTLKKSYEFGPKAFEGLKIFFNISKRGMCFNCHVAPLFTDQDFHNVGVTQMEYDSIHGKGAFRKFKVPSLSKRNNQAIYHLSLLKKSDKSKVDLGAWNFYARPGHENLTSFIESTRCTPFIECNKETILSGQIASFKTPSLRILDMSGPYFHNGSATTLTDTITQYIEFLKLSRERKAVNPDPKFRMMQLDLEDIEELEAFLSSLNEDYD